MFKFCATFVLLFVVIRFSADAADSACDDWQPFKEEECFKIFDKVGLQSYSDAEKICNAQDNSSASTLISIISSEEEEFLINLIKTHKISNDIWIGLKYSTGKYHWTDNLDLIYSNWATGNPKNKIDHCTELHSDEDALGKWSDVLCDKKNLVLCQKVQNWSLAHLQKLVLNAIKNPLPIGFIYVQLPNEKAPSEIWSWMEWKDISASYAGLFFRTEGGGSAAFGQIQVENTPRLTNVSHETEEGKKEAFLSPGAWSGTVHLMRGYAGSELHALKFYTAPGEVRPRNVAIRIWKRVG